MKQGNFVKIVVISVLTIGLIAVWFVTKSSMQTQKAVNSPAKRTDLKSEIAGFRSWTKVNDAPYIMWSQVEALCRMPTNRDYKMDTSIHKNKYVNIYVNAPGKDEMLTKKNPVFPAGTVVIKEKLPDRESTEPELLTVMIKREKGFNPEVGDWEFATLNGKGTEVTAQGKLQSCQSCHVDYEQNDFITRVYLPPNIQEKLK